MDVQFDQFTLDEYANEHQHPGGEELTVTCKLINDFFVYRPQAEEEQGWSDQLVGSARKMGLEEYARCDGPWPWQNPN